MILKDDQDQYLTIKCDLPDCDVRAPEAGEILAGRGLNNMGWHCSGGSHLCPTHAPVKPETDGAA